jgi:hypothetical protein
MQNIDAHIEVCVAVVKIGKCAKSGKRTSQSRHDVGKDGRHEELGKRK